MSRINLVIADTDSYYVEGLVKFLGEHYNQELQINYFTENMYLYSYLNSKGASIDILLISPELMADTFDFGTIKLVLILSGGRTEAVAEGLGTVNKYQRGDKLAACVLNAYAEKYPNEIHVRGCEKQARVTAVFSPIGGVGKSTLAIALAVQAAATGKKVFYLNLETIQTTPVFFNCSAEKTLSDVLYFVRDKNKALPIKIEGVKQVDTYTDIHYFSPPESISDLEEARPEELAQLVSQLKTMNKYSTVIVDMSCSLDKKNLSVLGGCDEIMVPFDQSSASGIRIQSFIRELRIMDSRFQVKLRDRCLPVLNKYVPAPDMYHEAMEFDGVPVEYRLPRTQALFSQRDGRLTINLNNTFGELIGALAERI